MKLLSVSADAKTIKGEKRGYLTGILYLAPANLSGVNVCANASPGCIAGCLNTAGRGGIFPRIIESRIKKTKRLFSNRVQFQKELALDIAALVRKAKRLNLIPCVRINGTSDLPWLALNIARRFPDVQQYDYTKHPKPYKRTLPNYHLTFSNHENNLKDSIDALNHHVNVAVVFPVKRGHALPDSWHGYPVIDGDVSDLRFLDSAAKVIGLRAKGRARRDTSGFVQIGGIN